MTGPFDEINLKKMQDLSKDLRVLEYAKYALSGCVWYEPVHDYHTNSRVSLLEPKAIVQNAFRIAEAFEEERARREDL